MQRSCEVSMHLALYVWIMIPTIERVQCITLHHCTMNTIEYITMHHNTIEYITMHHNKMNTIEYITMHHNTMNTIEYITMHHNTMNTMKFCTCIVVNYEFQSAMIMPMNLVFYCYSGG